MAYSEEYLINIQGEQKGPYTYPQLKQLYEKNLIPEETHYWQEGMEQWQPVADLCGASHRERARRLRRLRTIGIFIIVGIALITAYCAPIVQDGWREMNDQDFTQEGAYWRARGFEREDAKRHDASVAFENFRAATVTLTGTQATVVLPGTLFAKDGTKSYQRWQVVMDYNQPAQEWILPARK